MSAPEIRSNVLRLRFPLDNRWERHYGGPDRSVTTRLHATIGPKRRILLNANLYRLIGSPAEVLLYFNRQVSKIAIESANPGTTGAFPVTKRRGSYEIPAASFCRDNHFTVRTTQKFVNPQITHEGRLILDLKRTIPITRRRKPVKRAAVREDALPDRIAIK